MEQKSRGRFIVFEGIDGAGKTTQIELLEKRLKEQGRRVFRTAEPTESVTGGMLRDALAGISKRTACEMAALFTLDRIFHNVNPVHGIEKMLADGIDVICDRYYYSTLAYQGSEIRGDWAFDMNLNCPEIRRPDVCLFLDLTPEQSMERISKGRVTQEIYETHEKLEQVRRKFYSVFERLDEEEHIVIVDASKSIDEIAEEIYLIVNTLGIR
ncbi:MAG: dTMP kinase [Clostridia bacterium]|nr:dTMP kinase [Clostridia bacterium]